MKLITTQDYLLLIDEEAEINTLDAVINLHNNELHFALEECLHKDNNCKKVTAYYPLTKEAEELDLPLLPNPFNKKEEYYNKDAIIEAFYTDSREWKNRLQDYIAVDFKSWFEEKIKGNKKYITTKQFSLEDIENAFYMGWTMRGEGNNFPIEKRNYIQSLSAQQIPKEFILGKGDTIEEQIKNGHYEY